jgi:hypothetical protein
MAAGMGLTHRASCVDRLRAGATVAMSANRAGWASVTDRHQRKWQQQTRQVCQGSMNCLDLCTALNQPRCSLQASTMYAGRSLRMNCAQAPAALKLYSLAKLLRLRI